MSRPKKGSCAFPPYEDISIWDVHRMLQWLRQNGLHSSIDTFAEEKISGEMLLVSPTVADPECGFFLFDDVSISQ
jgi:hypothetical protein